MIHKDIRYRRHQRSRIIRKRSKTFKNAWGVIPVKHVGMLNKWNVSCNCDMCRMKTREIGSKISEQRKLLSGDADYENLR